MKHKYIVLNIIIILAITVSIFIATIKLIEGGFVRIDVRRLIEDGYAHVDGKTWYYREGVVPDEETAEKIAYILAEKHFGFVEGRDYDLRICFNEENNAWDVLYSPIHPEEGKVFLGGGRHIRIRKDNGAVIYLLEG